VLLNYLNHGEESAQLEEGIGTGFTQPGKVYRSESRRQNQAHQVNGGKVQQDIVSFYFTNVPHDISYSSLRQSFVVCGIMEDVYLARKRNVNGGAFGFVRYCKVRDVEKLLKALNNVWFRDWRVVAKVASFDRFGKSQAVGGKRVEGDKIIEGEKSKSEGAKNTEGVKKNVVMREDVAAGVVGREDANILSVAKNVSKLVEQPKLQYIPIYRLVIHDESWVTNGLVATMLNGEAISVLQ